MHCHVLNCNNLSGNFRVVHVSVTLDFYFFILFIYLFAFAFMIVD